MSQNRAKKGTLVAVLGLISVLTLGITIRRISRPGGDDAQQRLLEAISHESRGDRDLARQTLDTLLQTNPTFDRGLLLRAQIATDDGDIDLALKLLAAIDNSSPLCGSARFSAGVILRASHQLGKAAQAFAQAAELLENPDPAFTELASLQWLRIRPAETRDALHKKSQPWTLEELVIFLLAGRIGDPIDEHTQELALAVAADPSDADTAAAWGRYLLFREPPATVVEKLAPLQQTCGSNESFAATLAEALLLDGRPDEAKQTLDDAHDSPDTGPSLAYPLKVRGLLPRADANWRLGMHDLVAAFELQPGDPDINYKLSLALARLGKAELSTTLADRSLKLREFSTNLANLQKTVAANPESLPVEIGKLVSQLRQLQQFEEETIVRDWYSRWGFDRRHGPLPNDAEPLPTVTLGEQLRTFVNALTKPRSKKAPDSTVSARTDNISSRFLFEDVAAERGIDFHYFNGDSEELYIVGTLGGGAAVLDYDQDGWPDLFFPQGETLPQPGQLPDKQFSNALYRNVGGTSFTQVTLPAGLVDGEYSVGSFAADYDNDGDTDLLVTNVGTNRFYVNNGDGTFTEASVQIGMITQGISTSAVMADFDRDGDVDLFSLNYVAEMPVCRNSEGVPVVCHPRDLTAAWNVFFENLGNGTFRENSQEVGIHVPHGKSLGVVTCDFDQDGWLDVYVSNDTTPNFLFRSQGSITPSLPQNAIGSTTRFREMGLSSGTAVDVNGFPQAGMGIAVGDCDRNGLQDLYVTNFYADVNTLYLNDGDMMFQDDTVRTGLANPTRNLLGFGTQFLDADLDGWLDLFVLNGHIADNRKHGEPWKMRPQMFSNRGGRFEELRHAPESFWEQPVLGRGLSRLDFDRDGQEDLVATYLDRKVALLKNRTPAKGNQLLLEFLGKRFARQPTNLRVVVTTTDGTLTYQPWTGGYLGNDERTLTIPVGSDESVAQLKIIWPDGGTDIYETLVSNRRLLLAEGKMLINEPIGK